MSPFPMLQLASITLTLTALPILSACSGDDASKSAKAELCAQDNRSTIYLEDVWARPAPKGQRTSAVYAVICNGTDTNDRLLSVQTSAAQAAEIHETKLDSDGHMQMRPLTNLPVKAQSEAIFAPAGLHIMLIDIAQSLEVGATIPVTFTFENAGAVTVDAHITTEHTSDADNGRKKADHSKHSDHSGS